MTIDQAFNQFIAWLRRAIVVMVLISVAVLLLKSFGVTLPITKTITGIELAYLAGCYWLCSK